MAQTPVLNPDNIIDMIFMPFFPFSVFFFIPLFIASRRKRFLDFFLFSSPYPFTKSYFRFVLVFIFILLSVLFLFLFLFFLFCLFLFLFLSSLYYFLMLLFEDGDSSGSEEEDGDAYDASLTEEQIKSKLEEKQR